MLFNSVAFLFYFLPLFFAAYALCSSRNLLLLAGSLIFYAWGEARYLWLLFLVGIIAWLGGAGIHRSRSRNRSTRPALAVAIASELLLLAIFKYAPFVAAQLLPLSPVLARRLPLHLALPLGISFFTFHAISYLLDIHRDAARKPASPLQLAVYLTMFPQLIAGPIVRYATIADEIASQRQLRLEDFAAGIRRFVLGLAQKVLLADTLARPADTIFALAPETLDLRTAWFGTLCYSLQIHLDFAGYSLMAIGLARMMGLTLPENFRDPYISQSLTEFWRRWHITLSRWFRDYLYVPLGGNRQGRLRTLRNLWVVFLLCGLWHGASWNFVLWGAYHGGFLALERTGLGTALARLPRPLRHAYALLAIAIGWVLFRAEDMPHAYAMLCAMAGLGVPRPGFGQFVPPSVLAAIFAGAIVSLPLRQMAARLPTLRSFAPFGDAGFAALLLVLLVLSASSIASGTFSAFIYFRF